MKKKIFLFIALIITITSCREDILIEDTITIPFGEDVTTNLHGRIVDENGRSITETEIIVQDRTAFTNGDGYFYMLNISVPSDGFTINVRSQNNDKLIKRVTPQAGTNTYEEIVLTNAPESDAFSTTNESIVSNGQTSVTIPPNSLIDIEGIPYQGGYISKLIHYSPSDKNILRTMPGNLQGIDKNGNKVTLGTYGMIDIQVTDPNGEPLRLAPNSRALVRMDTPSLILENLSGIPTWKLDKTSGLWLEEGETDELIFIEDIAFTFFYIDEFTVWNCDIKELNTNLSGTIIDQFGVPLENRLIQFTFRSDGQDFFCSGGNTNSRGEFNTQVPKDLSITLNVYDKNCDAVIYTEDIGSFTEEDNIVKIETEFSIDSYTITGLVADCSGDIVFNNATVFLYDQSGNVRVSTQTKEDGSFAIHNTCYDTNFEEGYGIGVLDLETGNYIFKDSLIFSEIDIDLGNIIPCEEVDEFVNIISGFGDLSFDESSTFLGPDSLIINAGPTALGFQFSLVANISEQGINPVDFIRIEYSADQILTCTSLYQHTICSDAVTLTITEFDQGNQIISGNIEGALYYGDITEVDSILLSDVSIIFRVKY